MRDGLFKIAGDIVRKDGVLGLWGSVSIIAACQSMLEKFGRPSQWAVASSSADLSLNAHTNSHNRM